MMRKNTDKLSNRAIGILIVLLTLVYLSISVVAVQENPNESAATTIEYNRDRLSWGDVYAFGENEYNESNYNNVTGVTGGVTNINYYTSTTANNNATLSYDLHNHVGKITYKDHAQPVDDNTALKAHAFTLFRSDNLVEDALDAPIGNEVKIPVVTTTDVTGTYSVVPGSTGKYKVYVYSTSTPSGVKYAVLKDYASANDYDGTNGMTELRFTQIGETNWYCSDEIDMTQETITGLGWTAYQTGFNPKDTTDSNSASDAGCGSNTGKTLINTLLGNDDKYYYNEWIATEVKFDTVLVLQFPSSVSLGPITRADDKICVTNDNTKGSLTVIDIFGQPVSAVNTSVSYPHMPVFLSPAPANESYTFTGVEGIDAAGLTEIAPDLWRYNYEGSYSESNYAGVTLTAKWDQLAAIPTIQVSTGETLDGYFNTTGESAYTLSQETVYTFTADFTDTVDDSAVSYRCENNGKITEGELTSASPTLSVAAKWGTVVITFTIAGDGVEKTCTYTIRDRTEGLPIVARIGTTDGKYEYPFLEEAILASNNGTAGDIYLLTDYTMQSGEVPARWTENNNGYTIKSGVTLVVPYDEAGTILLDTASACSGTNEKGYQAPTEFRRLTIPNGVNIFVNGSINVGSKIHSAGGGSATAGAPTGPYGRIEMNAGSTITIYNGGSMYAWGFVTGTGTITAKSGANVHECFQLAEHRGGSGIYAMYNKNKGCFPFSQYYVQNIECPLTIEYGAKETGHGILYVQGDRVADTTFIGSGGLFVLSEGSKIIKQYKAGEDRIQFDVYGSASLSSIVIELYGYSFDSSQYILPINGNMAIRIHSGTTTISNNTSLLPGAILQVDEGATITVASGKYLYVYDSVNWLKASNGATAGSGGSNGDIISTPSTTGYGFAYSNMDLVPVKYAPSRQYNRTAENMEDAVVDVNGTMTVLGYLNTTGDTTSDTKSGGGCIISSNGTGMLSMNSIERGELNQAINQEGSSFLGKVYYKSVPITAAQLKNGAAYEGTEKEYVQTADGGTGTYKYDKATEQWYKYRVNYVFDGATVYTDYIYTDTSTYTPSGIASLSASATNGTASVSDGTVTVTGISGDSTITLSGSAETYTPYFVLNEGQYALYQSFTGNTLSTTSIGGQTYYVVSESSAMSFGAVLSAPSDAEVGVSDANNNSITWRLSDSPVGAVFGQTVPQGEEGKAYIYGFYSGYVAEVTTEGVTTKYSTLERAFNALEMNKTSTIRMLADCGSYEDEDAAATLSTPAGSTITFDLAGHTAVGALINNNVMTLDLNGGVFKRDHAEVQTSASAAVFNLGRLTIKNSGAADETHGVISNNSWRTPSGNASNINVTAEYFQAVVRNSGENAFLTVESGVLLSQEETGYTPSMAEDRFDAVGIVNVNGATLVDSKGDINVPKGAAIYNFSGTIKSISGGTITAYQGIYNRNMRSATGKTPFIATIELIGGDVQITVARYAVHNRVIVNEIGGNVLLQAADYVVNCRGDHWFYDTNLAEQTNETNSPYKRTNKYVTDESQIATIKRITGGIVKATTNFAIHVTGGGILEEISDGYITAPKQAIRVIGYRPTEQTTTYFDKIGGVVKTQDTSYELSRLKCISGGRIETTGGANAIENYAYIDSITGGTFTSSTGSTIANLNSDSNQYQRIQYEKTANDVTYDENKAYEYFQATIDNISGVTVNAGSSGGSNQAILNRGLINTISGVTLNGKQYVLANGDGANNTCSRTRTTILKCLDSSKSAEKDISRTYYVPTINTIDDITVSYTSYGVRNYGYIGQITNSTISTTGGERAIDNEGNIRTSLDCTYTWNGKDPTVDTTTTKSTAGEINLIGGGNTLQAMKNVVINFGKINTIDGGGTTTVTATSGVGIYNYRGLKILENGEAYQNPVIRTIQNIRISATSYGIQNGEGNATYGVATINELGSGIEVISSSDDAVRNSASAELSKISGGIYTANKSGKYAVYNNTSAPIVISGGDFKGGTNDDGTLGRAYAIFEPDITTRQTYPYRMGLTPSGTTRSVTFADGTTGSGYYYISLTNPAAETVTGETTPNTGTRVGYATLAEAIKAYEKLSEDDRKNTYITLMDNTTETSDIEVSQNLYLDLNGKTVNLGSHSLNLGAYTLYGMDASTNGFDAAEDKTGQIIGTITHNEKVEKAGVADVYSNTGIGANVNKSYVTVTSADENNSTVTEFHRFAITPITCRFYYNPNAHSHLAFKAALRGDDTVIGLIQDLGFEINGEQLWYGQTVAFEGTDQEQIDGRNYKTVSLVAVDYEGTTGFDTKYTVTAMAAFGSNHSDTISGVAGSPVSMSDALALAKITVG